jgi:hydrogenase maturation protein HypF
VIVEVCGRIRTDTGLSTVALSGGVFQNRRLVELVVPLLDGDGFAVLRHAQVPPNDGGISLGQVAIGRAHLDQGVSS